MIKFGSTVLFHGDRGCVILNEPVLKKVADEIGEIVVNQYPHRDFDGPWMIEHDMFLLLTPIIIVLFQNASRRDKPGLKLCYSMLQTNTN